MAWITTPEVIFFNKRNWDTELIFSAVFLNVILKFYKTSGKLVENDFWDSRIKMIKTIVKLLISTIIV